MTTPHIMFRDDSGKLHATPSLSLAADLANLLGSEVFARRAMECRAQLREAFDRADALEVAYGDRLMAQPVVKQVLSRSIPLQNQGE